MNGVVPGGEDAQVQGGLHQAGHIGAHGLDAVGQAGEHTHHAAAGAFIQGQQGGFRRADGDGDGRVVDPVFLFEGGVHFGADGLGGAGIGGHQSNRPGGDGVVLETAADGDDPQVGLFLQGAQHPAQQHTAVGAALVDLRAGVTAHQTGDGDLQHRGAEGTAGYGQAAVSPGTAGTADGENALVLGVHIQHPAALQHGDVQPLGAVHAGFLVHGEDGLDGRVGQGIIVQNGHGHGHGNAVVAAQGGAPGGNGVALQHQVQALDSHVLGAAGLLFADHVHVTLEDHRLRRLIAGGGVPEDHHVVQLVLDIPQAPGLGKIHQPVADGFGVAGTVGDGAQLLEETKNTLGLQMIQNGHNARSFYIFSRVSIPYFPGICKGEGNGDYRGRESPIERL